ncbi:MAG: response regulator [Treponema sp.]|nr:response regulator [Treponema sp.]
MYVLLADDEQLECDALELLIKGLGYNVNILKAKNGKEAVALAKEYHPQIVLLDIQMPVLSGLDAAEQIRELLPLAVIVFITAWGRFDFAQRAIRVGAVDYLVKPIDKQKVRKVFDMCMALVSKGEKVENEPGIYADSQLYQRLVALQQCILDGDDTHSLEKLSVLLQFVDQQYTTPDDAGKILYDLYGVLCYDIAKSVAFIKQDKPSVKSVTEVESCFVAFIHAACAAVREDKKDKYNRVFVLIRQYIDGHFAEQLSANMVAEQFDLQSVYFSRLFSKYCDMTFVEYLTKIRMEHAKEAVLAGKLIKNVAVSCGYNDTNYFSKVFHKYYGMSPLEFQIQNKK